MGVRGYHESAKHFILDNFDKGGINCKSPKQIFLTKDILKNILQGLIFRGGFCCCFKKLTGMYLLFLRIFRGQNEKLEKNNYITAS